MPRALFARENKRPPTRDLSASAEWQFPVERVEGLSPRCKWDAPGGGRLHLHRLLGVYMVVFVLIVHNVQLGIGPHCPCCETEVVKIKSTAHHVSFLGDPSGGGATTHSI